MSDLLNAISAIFKILRIHTSPYHPQTDGLVERFNRTLANMLSSYCSSHQNDWDVHIASCLFAYRNAPHASTGETPFYLMYLRHSGMPEDIIWTTPQSQYMDIPDYKTIMMERLQIAWTKAGLQMKYNQETMKENYDRKTKEHTFNIGDLVLVHQPFTPKGLTSKLRRPFKGPYKVIQVTPTNLKLKSTSNKKADPIIVHVNRCKLSPPEIEHKYPLRSKDKRVGCLNRKYNSGGTSKLNYQWQIIIMMICIFDIVQAKVEREPIKLFCRRDLIRRDEPTVTCIAYTQKEECITILCYPRSIYNRARNQAVNPDVYLRCIQITVNESEKFPFVLRQPTRVDSFLQLIVRNPKEHDRYRNFIPTNETVRQDSQFNQTTTTPLNKCKTNDPKEVIRYGPLPISQNEIKLQRDEKNGNTRSSNTTDNSETSPDESYLWLQVIQEPTTITTPHNNPNFSIHPKELLLIIIIAGVVGIGGGMCICVVGWCASASLRSVHKGRRLNRQYDPPPSYTDPGFFSAESDPDEDLEYVRNEVTYV